MVEINPIAALKKLKFKTFSKFNSKAINIFVIIILDQFLGTKVHVFLGV